MKNYLILSVGLLCLASCWNRAPQKEDASRGYIVKTGEEAPDFTIRYLDGHTQQLSDLRGKTVMLQFTASWCGVCRREMPHIESEIWQKYKDHPRFALIGVDYMESPDVTQQFAADVPVTYPLTLDETGEKFHLYAAQEAGVTRNIIIDRTGRILFLTRLYDENEFSEMLAVIEKELAER
jgi:peroxiredoxin